jgi:hypothetical protein
MALSWPFVATLITPNDKSLAKLTNVNTKTMVTAETYPNVHPKISQQANHHGSPLLHLLANETPTCRVKIRPLGAKLWHLEIMAQKVPKHYH